MSLIKELQSIASDPNTSASDVFKKALIVSKRLKQNQFSNWIFKELYGYQSNDEIPSYRKLKGVIKFDITTTVTKKYNEMFSDKVLYEDIDVRQNLSEIENILKINEKHINLSIGREMNNFLQNYCGNQYPEVAFRFYISVSNLQFFNILELCKMQILNWALDLENEGIIGDNDTFNNNEKRVADISEKPPFIANYITNNNNATNIFSNIDKKEAAMAILCVIVVNICCNWIAGGTQHWINEFFNYFKEVILNG